MRYMQCLNHNEVNNDVISHTWPNAVYVIADFFNSALSNEGIVDPAWWAHYIYPGLVPPPHLQISVRAADPEEL